VRLTTIEAAAIDAGCTTILREQRVRNGRKLKVSTKRGDIAHGHGVYAQILSIREHEGKWEFRVEQTGEWALRAKEDGRKMSKADLEDALPGVLSWDEQPDVQVGDIFVFEREKIRDANGGYFNKAGNWCEGGEAINEDVPSVYIEVVSVGRGKKGEHIARYRKHGFEDDQYLAPKLGYTTNRHRALSSAPAPEVRVDPAISTRDEMSREYRRLQQLRACHQREIMRAKGPGQLARLTISLADVERKMRGLQGEVLEKAA
jgi:hypothetical protein